MSLTEKRKNASITESVVYVENGQVSRVIISDFHDIMMGSFTFGTMEHGKTVIEAYAGENIVADEEGNAVVETIIDTITVSGSGAEVKVGSTAIYTDIEYTFDITVANGVMQLWVDGDVWLKDILEEAFKIYLSYDVISLEV